MNTLLLCLPLAFQGAPTQAELHPAQADLFVAVPDVQAIVNAYGSAPLMQTLSDEGMQAFLTGAGVQLEGDHRKLLKEWVDQMNPGSGALLDGVRAFSLSFTLDPEGEKPFGLGIVAAFSSPEQALAAQKLALDSGTPVGALEVAGLTGGQRFTSADMEGMELWCATVGERFALGGGSTSAAGFAARLAGTEPGLDSNELLAAAGKALSDGSGATVFWLYQARSPFELLGEADQASSMLGGAEMLPYDSIPGYLDPLAGQRVMRMQLRKSRFVTEMFSKGGMEAGALGGQPVQGDWLGRVPPDAMFAYSTAVDGAKLAPRLREVLGFLESDVLQMGAAEGGEKTDVLAEAVSGLGPGMVAYMFPVAGIGAPQTHLWFDVDDAAAFTAKMTSLCEKLAQTEPGFSSRTRPYKVKNKATGERKPFDITTITLPPDALGLGPMLAVSPSFATVDDKILFGLSSMHVKRELKRLYSGEEGGGGDPWSQHGFAVPDGARSVVFMDWGMQIEAAINLARAFAGMAGDELPIDLNSMPDAKSFTQFLRPTFHVARDVEGGTYRYHEASFGPETWLGLLGAVMMGRSESTESAWPPPSDEAEPIPVPAQPVEGGGEGDGG